MKLLSSALWRIIIILKLIIYKIIYYKNIKINNVLNMRLGKSFKIVIEDDISLIHLSDDISCRDYVTFRLCGGKLNIGKNVFFNSFVSINCMEEIHIGNDCLFGENVKIYDHDHIFNRKLLIREQGFRSKDIHIGNNVWIGSNCVILKGVKIGNDVVIGAGTIIREDIPNGTIVYNDSIINSSNILYK